MIELLIGVLSVSVLVLTACCVLLIRALEKR